MELLRKLRLENATCQWKQGLVTQEEHRNTVQACRDWVSKAKAHLEWHLVRDVKGKMVSMGTPETKGRQSKMWTNCGTRQGTWWQRTLKRLKHSMSSLPWSLRVTLRYLRPAGRSGGRKTYTQQCRKNQVRDHLNKLDIPKFIGPDGLHSPVLSSWFMSSADSEFDSLCWLGEVSEDWKNAKITYLFKNRKEEDLGNYRQVRLSLIPGKMVEEILLETSSKHEVHEGI